MSMLVVAVTGRSGSGKSTVASHYASLGYPVADGDEIARLVTGPGSPCLAELVEAFGPGILAPDGTLLRQKLAGIAFASPAGNQKLTEITHRHITRELMCRMKSAEERKEKLFFVDGAVIVGQPIQKIFDKIIVVTAEMRLSISRIILRDGISKTAAHQRLDAQTPEEALRAAADYVIENNAGEAQLIQKADEVLQQLLHIGEARQSPAHDKET